MKGFLLFIILSLMLSSLAYAGIKTVGSGDAIRIDPSGFPAAMKARYEIMKAKCVTCHSMEWTIIAIKTGVAPISGQPFDRKATKAYGMKMMRKPGSNMTKEETMAVVELLNFLLDEAAR